MAAEQVEAKSLSALNFLAANPPQYPNNPTEERHEALVLYISRVPGARDVILSTFKPQRKNVTGEDVANSLYYVHLDVASDEHLVPPRPLRDGGSPRSSGESARLDLNPSSSPPGNNPPIQRKPLPANARVPSLENHVPETPSRGNQPTTYPGARQTDLQTGADVDQTRHLDSQFDHPDAPVRHSAQASQSLPAPVPRKPLGPRPMGTVSVPEKDLPAPPMSDVSRPPPFPPRPSLFTDEPGQISSTPAPLSRSPSPSKRRDTFTPFTITLIRRDPTSGNQWNIGKVSSLQSNEPVDDITGPESPMQMHHARGHPAINIHLETSGYAKFRGFPMRPNLDPFRPSSSSSLPRNLGEVGESKDELVNMLKGPAAAPEEGFSRQVVMSYSKTWTSNLRQAFKKRERSGTTGSLENEPLPTSPGANRGRSRKDSNTSIGWGDEPGEGDDREGRDTSPLITQPGQGLKPKGYIFSSPWDGRCEFRTGNGGRSLKCRHVLNTGGGGFNPLVLAQGIRDGNLQSHRRGGSISASITGTAAVSELRFNLPSADLFKSKEDRERAMKELQGQFGKLMKGHPDDSDGNDDDDEPIFDLSLGREKAGGGNRGKRAKLGKLIIYNDGLKMLDLVVAANMGVWWGAWERSF